MAFHVAELTVPATTAVDVLASVGVAAANYTVYFAAIYGALSLVSSTSASSAGFPTTNLVIDGTSDVYIYNSSGSAVSVYLLFMPIAESQGPISSATTFTY